jgi:hypothetical protein
MTRGFLSRTPVRVHTGGAARSWRRAAHPTSFLIMEEKHVKTRIAAWIGAILIGLTVIACGTAPDSKPTKTLTITPSAKAPAAKTTRAPAKKQLTTEQSNAARSAQRYLDSETGFSRKGLIEQLVYEDYSKAAATVAVDSLGVDWNAQAALRAQNYLDDQAFSRNGLIKQLKYEGYTAAQAAYGVKQAGL